VEIGVKGVFAVPVTVHNECIMVLEFYSSDAQEPDHELLAVIANAAEQIGRRMEREQADQALRAAKAQAERAEKRAQSAAEEARAASQAKSDFLANMSHELRTPLNGILGLAALIEQETLGPLGHEQYAGYVRIIGSSGRHLVTVINDVLDYSKIEAGMLELDPAPFDLGQVTGGAIDLLASSAQAKAIGLTCSLAPEVPLNLIGDQDRLRQVLLNLTGNAIKFTDEGSVSIEVSLAAARGNAVSLRFEIADTGIGIARHAQEKLFDKFIQADLSTTRKYGGTGLGLAISRQLVGLMDGEIGVDSELGQGSTFWFTVKLARQADEAKGERGMSEAGARGFAAPPP
jgi:signal transduction histidine kinase